MSWKLMILTRGACFGTVSNKIEYILVDLPVRHSHRIRTRHSGTSMASGESAVGAENEKEIKHQYAILSVYKATSNLIDYPEVTQFPSVCICVTMYQS